MIFGRGPVLLGACAMILTACGRYADFTLPLEEQGHGTPRIAIEASPLPILPRGAPGEWDANDVLNPSVVQRGGEYFNFYSGFDGRTWHTGLAVSRDGAAWTKEGKVLSPDPSSWEGDDYIAANGSALYGGDAFLYWYQAGRLPRIGLARSKDGRSFSKLSSPVLPTGPRGSWDERGVADPYVIRIDDVFYMYYLGQDRARRQRLGVARSSDGISWTKLRSNPVLELGQAGSFDEVGLGEPAVWRSRGRYWMLYTGRDRREHRRIGLAISNDGVRWTRFSEAPVFSGDASWNAKVVCDPSVIQEADRIRVWYGGGDAASPDENLHGEIGLFTLRVTLTR
jgi:predicted GH43/DUF377 family glycosyl hydrolase